MLLFFVLPLKMLLRCVFRCFVMAVYRDGDESIWFSPSNPGLLAIKVCRFGVKSAMVRGRNYGVFGVRMCCFRSGFNI